MTNVIGQGVSLKGYHFSDSIFTFNLKSDIVATDAGKAVTIDTSAANTVKLAGDGDPIFGRLETVEIRAIEGINVGAVALRFSNLLEVADSELANITVGDEVQGAGSGTVKVLTPYVDTDGTGTPDVTATTHQKSNVVVEKVSGDTDYVVVMKV